MLVFPYLQKKVKSSIIAATSKCLEKMSDSERNQNQPFDHDAANEEVNAAPRPVVDESEAEVESIHSPKFENCQNILARDKDGLLYDAVIRRSIWGINRNSQATIGMVDSQEEMEHFLQQQTVATWHYFVHYTNWKPNWDRWISEHDVLDASPANKDLGRTIMQEHKALQKEIKNNKRRKIDGGAFLKTWKLRLQKLTGSPKTESDPRMKPTKKSWENDFKLSTKQLSPANHKSSISQQIVLSFGLKKILLEEWEIINQYDMLHQLPAGVTVRQALDRYLESKGIDASSLSKDGGPQERSVPQNDNRTQEWLDMVRGITMFFEQALAFRLLYPSELSQLSALESSDQHQAKEKADIYGCEFLLRLFCQLPSILDDAYDQDDDVGRGILAKLNDFLRFLQKNQLTLFEQSYRKKHQTELLQEHKEAKREERKRKAFAMQTNLSNL